MARIENLNYVYSEIITETINIETTSNTTDAVLVIGTARAGKTGVLTEITYTDVDEKFGDAPSPLAKDFDTNIAHSALAIQASTANRNIPMYGYKVGDSSRAKVELYEMQITNTGDLSFTVDSEGNPVKSLVIEYQEENEIGNNTSVEVRGNESGEPSAIVFNMPDGYRKVISIDPYGVRPGVASNVRELIAEVLTDENLNKLTVNYAVLRKENYPVTVQGSGIPYIEVLSLGQYNSWGDKLETIEKIEQELTYIETLQPGNTVNTLKFTPIKDDDPMTVTITKFVKTIENEVLITAGVTDIGKTTLTKTLVVNSTGLSWDRQNASVVFSYVRHIRGTQVTDIPLTDYVFNNGDMTISTMPSLQPNDKVEVGYSFTAALREANMRSDILIGSESSYFVAGNSIRFGAAPTLPLTITYDAIKKFNASDLNVQSANDIVVQFINPANAPLMGEIIYLTFTYLPELPAATSTVIVTPAGSFIQPSGLSGGTSGSFIDKQRYKELVLEALDDTVFIPFRKVKVAGAWGDDIINGIDEETGLPGKINLNWASEIAEKLKERSEQSQECSTAIGMKPLLIDQISKGQKAINAWQEYLVSDFGDRYSAATIKSALDSYFVDMAVGSMFVSDPKIATGAQYIEDPSLVLLGMQLDATLVKSLFTQSVPGFVKKVLVGFNGGTQLSGLNAMGYTTFHLNYKGDIKVADAPTCASISNPIRRQLVRDTVFETIKIARESAYPFIGERRDKNTLSRAESKINKEISQVMVPNYANLVQCKLIPTRGGYINGNSKLQIFIETNREISSFSFETRVKLGGEDL